MDLWCVNSQILAGAEFHSVASLKQKLQLYLMYTLSPYQIAGATDELDYLIRDVGFVWFLLLCISFKLNFAQWQVALKIRNTLRL